jgi:hypothetical protein
MGLESPIAISQQDGNGSLLELRAGIEDRDIENSVAIEITSDGRLGIDPDGVINVRLECSVAIITENGECSGGELADVLDDGQVGFAAPVEVAGGGSEGGSGSRIVIADAEGPVTIP